MSETKNLKLFKHDEPLETNQNPFDVDKALNNNWDKIDDFVGEIDNKIDTLEEDISTIKTEQIEQNSELEALRSALPSETQEGENINIKGTIPVKFKKFVVKGNSKQETRSGKNLLPYPYNIVQNFIIQDLGDGRIILNGTQETNTSITIKTFNLKAGTYKFLFNTAALPNNSYFFIRNQSTSEILKTNIKTNTTFSLEEDTLTRFDLVLVAGSYSDYKLDLMVLDATEEDETWEQYGAMPSPEYPSEIQNVEGDVNATVSNKNLFKMPNKEETAFNNITYLAENQNIKINGTGTTGKYPWIIITKNNIYNKNGTPTLNDILQWQDGILAIGKITATLKRISGTSDWEINMNLYDESGEVVNNEIADTTKIVAIGLYLGNGKTFNNLILGIQIEKGEIATEYVEHQEQTVTFPLSQGQKLYLGDYLAEDGIHHVRKQIELDGTDFSLYSNQVAGRTIYTISAFSNNNNFKTYDSSILCNILKQGNSNNGNNYLNNTASSGNLHVSIENSFLGITNESTEEEKLQALQNLIAKTGFIYEGELAEEEIEAYTPEQQEAYNQIKELTAYEEETNVYSTNEISPIFKVTAIKDINSVITQLNTVLLERS